MFKSRRDLLKRLAAAPAFVAGLPLRYALAADSDADVALLKPSDPAFAAHRQIFNKRIALVPAVIAVCRSEAGVQKAVLYAAAQKLPIAIKSGGHSLEGYCLNDGGLVVDVSAMNRLTTSPRNVLTAQPGATLSRIYDHLLPRGRLLPAGSCGGVGIAGLALGGGYGLFSRKLGLTCDNLLRVRLIDAKGVTHDSAQAPDLLWACRGGGTGSFGVVTELEFATHRAPATLHSHRLRYRIESPADAVRIAASWFAAVRELPDEAYSALIANSKVITVLVTSFLRDVGDKRVAGVLDKLSAHAARALPTASQPLGVAVRRYYGLKGPVYFKNVSAGFYDGFGDIEAAAHTVFEGVLRERGVIMQINTFGPLKPRGDSAFAHYGRAFIGELQAYWEQPSQESRAVAAVARLQHALAKAGVRAHYANYPDPSIENWPQAYYGEHYARLQSIKRRYDPQNMFRHPQSIRAA